MYNDIVVEVETITIEHTDELVDVYNFEVEDAHTYYVTDKGVLVHNICVEGAIQKAKDAGIEVKSASDLADEFADGTFDMINSLSKNSSGATISNHVTGTKIHYGFMENGKIIENVGLRVDGLRNGILYELKPRNARSIIKAIGQMKKYQKALGNVTKLVLY